MGSALNTVKSVAGTEFRHMQVRRQVAEDVRGQTLTANTWNTRTIDTVTENQIPGASLVSNQVTLPAGTYRIRATVRQYRVDTTSLRWRQVSGTPTDVVLGMCGYSNSSGTGGDGGQTYLEGRFTTSSTQTFELQHYVQAAPDSINAGGLRLNGTAGPAGVDGVFVVVDIYQEIDAVNIRGIETGKLFHVRDEKSTGTAGGTFTSGSWVTRDLNTTKLNEIDDASLGTNQFTLPAGTYYIDAQAPACFVNRHKARLQNVTDATTVIESTNAREGDTSTSQSWAYIRGKFTLTAAKTFEIQHQCQTSQSTVGLGHNVGDVFSGVTEVYTEVQVWKVGN